MAAKKVISKTLLKCALILLVLVVSCLTAFHSKKGCCICLKKRQEGKKFLSSRSFESFFSTVFNVASGSRQGDLCRACYMAISRWKKTGKIANQVSRILLWVNRFYTKCKAKTFHNSFCNMLTYERE